MNPARRPNRRAGAVGTALAAVLLSGCSAFSEQTTGLDYAPSDGVQGELDQVGVRNAFVVASGAGSPGTLVGSLVNNGDEDVTVTLTSEVPGLSGDIEVPAGQVVMLGPDGDETVETPQVGTVPGRHLLLAFSTDGGTALELDVPVLDGTLPEYADLVPTEAPAPEPVG